MLCGERAKRGILDPGRKEQDGGRSHNLNLKIVSFWIFPFNLLALKLNLE